MKKILLSMFFFNLFFYSYAQQDPLWTKLTNDQIASNEKLERKSNPREFQIYALDFDLLKTKLAAAPPKEYNKTKPGVIITFPTAEGVLENFKVYKAPVMNPDLAARYQEIQSYVGIGIDNPTSTIRFSVTIFGLHTMTFMGNGETGYIDTYTKDLRKYIVYNRSQLENPGGFLCGVHDPENQDSSSERTTNSILSNTGIFRVYRLAVATTVEYSNFHISAAGLGIGASLAQKKAAVLAAIVITMTRVNGIYERDLAVTMELVSNENSIISIGTDNLTNNDPDSLISESQDFIDTNIGNSNYDIGHTFSTGAGGLAEIRSVCVPTRKAMGVTGTDAPVDDAFDIDYVAHEMGHQFGGNHTFNSAQSNCGEGNRNAPTAVEPGSGTTIMAYAGICPPDNVQLHSDAHFHAISLAEMNTHIAGTGNCSVNTPTNNTAPVITVTNYTIPKSTPFILKGSATDAEGDELTYCWEQTNIGSLTTQPTATTFSGPNFRSRPPNDSPERYMPILSSVVANNITPSYEVIPSVARVLNFALTVRDNSALNGPQTNRANMSVSIANTGPFLVTSPNTNVAWQAGTTQAVTWDVAGTTDTNSINSQSMDIYLSTDSGVSFDTLLASGVPNDGSETIIVPNIAGSTNRIMVRAHDNIFYDISNTNFTITPGLGIDDNTVFSFSVYPNPNTGNFNIQSDNLNSEKIKIQVYDMRGRAIYYNEYNGSNKFNENIHLNNVEAGVYLLSVTDGTSKNVQRIIIK